MTLSLESQGLLKLYTQCVVCVSSLVIIQLRHLKVYGTCVLVSTRLEGAANFMGGQGHFRNRVLCCAKHVLFTH